MPPRQIDIQVNRQTNKQTDRHTDRQTYLAAHDSDKSSKVHGCLRAHGETGGGAKGVDDTFRQVCMSCWVVA